MKLLLISASGFGQDEKRSFPHSHSLQLGFGPWSYSGLVLESLREKLDYKDISETSVRGPIHLRYTYRFAKRWSAGASMNYARYRASFKDIQLNPNDIPVEIDIHVTLSSYSFLGRVQFFPVVQKHWEMYLATSLGLRVPAYSISSNVPWASFSTPGIIPVGGEAVLGIRYMPIKNLGLYTEIGAAKSPIQLGLVCRFIHD